MILPTVAAISQDALHLVPYRTKEAAYGMGATRWEAILKVIRAMPIPVLLTAEDSYQVASKVHDLTVKTRPVDAEKISLIRDLIAKNVNVDKILEAL